MDRDTCTRCLSLSRRIAGWRHYCLARGQVMITSVPAHVHFPAAFRFSSSLICKISVRLPTARCCASQQCYAPHHACSIGITPSARFADNIELLFDYRIPRMFVMTSVSISSDQPHHRCQRTAGCSHVRAYYLQHKRFRPEFQNINAVRKVNGISATLRHRAPGRPPAAAAYQHTDV